MEKKKGFGTTFYQTCFVFFKTLVVIVHFSDFGNRHVDETLLSITNEHKFCNI